MTQPPHKVQEEYVYEDMVLMKNYYPPCVLEQVRDFDLSGDVLIASYPKTGTTWTQELAWLLMNDGNLESANSELSTSRVRYLELVLEDTKTEMDYLTELPHPRTTKTHLPANFFAKQLETDDMKIIIPIRNPKDTLVSFYHFYRMNSALGNFAGSWTEFFNMLVVKKHLLYGDYFSWYKSWLQVRHPSKILFVKFEDMTKDMKKEIERTAGFIKKEPTESMIKAIANHCTFKAMKANPNTNWTHMPNMDPSISPFMRKGVVGDWKNYFTEEQSKLIDERYQNELLPLGMTLEFE